MFRKLLFLILGLVLLQTISVMAQGPVVEVCPATGIRSRPVEFAPDGIILTTFDNAALWVYNIGTDTRYPLPETVPCSRNCSVSPTSDWILRMGDDFNFYKMRLDGTQRTLLTAGAAAVQWWSTDTLLVWTPDYRAYLLPDGAPNTEDQRTYLDTRGVVALQPGGTNALALRRDADGRFLRELEDIELRGLVGVAGAAPVVLGEDVPYFNDAAWSPSGEWLAFVRQIRTGEAVSSEVYGIRPGDPDVTQLTDLTTTYGPVRVNGQPIGDLSWSPDATQLAFWVMPLPDGRIESAGPAKLHVYDLPTGETRAYCTFTTEEHLPAPPRLIWSPDGSHVAFGGNVPGDNKGYLLLALNVADGTLTELSDGIFPALGTADVIAWGVR
ncbi:MAG: hypothetical protein AAF125_10210 [Chloroflexota bacterium]